MSSIVKLLPIMLLLSNVCTIFANPAPKFNEKNIQKKDVEKLVKCSILKLSLWHLEEKNLDVILPEEKLLLTKKIAVLQQKLQQENCSDQGFGALFDEYIQTKKDTMAKKRKVDKLYQDYCNATGISLAELNAMRMKMFHKISQEIERNCYEK